MDQLRQPGVYVDGFQCASATVTCTLNQTLNLTATVCEGNVDGNILTAEDIMSLGKTMQEKIFKNPSSKDVKVTFNDGIGGTLNYSLTLTSCNIVSSPSGGLKLELSATTEDILCDAFDPSVYIKCVDYKSLLQVTWGKQTSQTTDHRWVYLLKDKGAGSTPLAKKIDKLLTNTKDNYVPSFIGQSEGTKAAINSQKALNEQIYKDYVKAFLTNSLDSTDILGKQVSVTDDMNRAIFNGLATIFFDSSGGFLNKVINILCPEFLLWYIPDHKKGGMGMLKNQNYVKPKKPKKLTLPISAVKMSLGRSLGNSLPPTMCCVQTPLQFTVLNTAGKYSKFIMASYPEKPENRLGIVYNISAPKWFYVSAVDYTDDKPAKENQLNKARTANGVKAEQKKITQADSKTKKAFTSALKYLAEHAFNKLKYSTSVAGVTCPFQANIDAELGDFVTLSATEGGTILTGILTSITHSVTASGGMVTNLGFARVEIA